jgi:hypothetical protein
MTSPLSGSLAATIGKAFKNIFLDATLTRDGATTGPAYDPVAGTAVSYSCKAIAQQYSTGMQGQGLVGATDAQILILATSLAVTPQPLDRISIPSQSISGTIVPADASGLQAVSTDPAKAVWQCRART